MKRLLVPVIVGLLLVARLGLAADDQPAKNPLLGGWKFISLENQGQKQGEDDLRQIRLVVEEKKMKIVRADNQDTLTTIDFLLDSSTEPALIDLTINEQSVEGIFRVVDGTWTMCLGPIAVKQRPTDFSAEGGQILVVLKRDKP
ncbi:MAG: TIGR03067 domain-containing protein [Gemmataceae bacterium]